MKVTVITGSVHKKGTTALLADKFIEGATEAGHDVYSFDAAFEDVKPCSYMWVLCKS
jgi:multimeric flavodoxin WrbA